MRRILGGIVSGLLSTALAFAPGFAKEKSLYERLGGKTTIVAVVDEFVGRVAADKRINGSSGRLQPIPIASQLSAPYRVAEGSHTT